LQVGWRALHISSQGTEQTDQSLARRVFRRGIGRAAGGRFRHFVGEVGTRRSERGHGYRRRFDIRRSGISTFNQALILAIIPTVGTIAAAFIPRRSRRPSDTGVARRRDNSRRRRRNSVRRPARRQRCGAIRGGEKSSATAACQIIVIFLRVGA